MDIQARSEGAGRFSVRPYTDADLPAVRALVTADRLPGEPPSSGHLPDVPPSGEDFDAVAALLAFARAHLGHRKLHAFTAPATTTGVPGLPMRHRPATAKALTAAGFTPATAQEYLLRDLDDPEPAAPDYPIADVTLLEDFRGWRLAAPGPDATGLLAGAVLSRPDPGSGTAALWHLAVHPEHRRRGIGHRLLAQCLDVAATGGGRYLAAFTDPDDEAAMRLLAAQDFNSIDTFAVYHCRP
ncbi:GNAT family N-acetyltransferase [Streptomyces sp. NPDC096153]|uniref:GNAT family N-acetyltransferase n=1 Tax=Streptomyces sp. NPDC096153 TaxID=3155548 RepID=UPI00331C3855